MGLVLGVLTPGGIVLAADSLELQPRVDGVEVPTGRQVRKLFPLRGRPAAVAHVAGHRLAKAGGTMAAARPIDDLLAEFEAGLPATAAVLDLAGLLVRFLERDVWHTQALLADSMLHRNGVGFWVAGFDPGGGPPKLFELWWPDWTLSGIAPNHRPQAVQHPAAGAAFGVLFGGSGRTVPQTVISRHGSRYRPDHLKEAGLEEVRQYLRGLYAKSEGEQVGAQLGGPYQEVTVTPSGCEVSTPA